MKKLILTLFIITLNTLIIRAQYSFIELPTSPTNTSSGNASKLPISFKNNLFFSGSVAYNNGGSELFKYDGTNVTLFADINVPGHSSPADLFNVNDDYFLFTAQADATGRELYASDGLTIWLLKDIRMGTADGMENGGNDYLQYVTLNNKTYFFAREDDYGYDLWRTDGTPLGTEKVAELNEFNLGLKGDIIVFNNAIYFTMSVGGDREMYKYEDVGNTVTKVFEMNTSGSSQPSQYLILDNHLFFVASSASFEREWYYTNGVNMPTLINLNGSLSTQPDKSIVYGNKIYFVGAVGTFNNRDPYAIAYNAVSSSFEVILLKDFVQGTLNGTVLGANSSFIPYSGAVYFAAREFGIDGNLWQLYKTDGTSLGTQKAVNITTTHTGGIVDNEIEHLTVYNGKLFFGMSATPFGSNQLWVADGTLSNLSRLTDNGAANMRWVNLHNAIIHNNTLIVSGFSSVKSAVHELWKIIDNATLPVQLVDFITKRENNYGKLQWQTSSETNNKGFEIYRSGDDKAFVKIGDIDGKGAASSYVFTDKQPLNGNNYYKLVQVDKDGTPTNIGERVLSFSLSAQGLQIYPNPTTNKVVVNFEVGKYTLLTLCSVEGKVLKEISLQPSDSMAEVDLLAYARGVYVVKLIGVQSVATKIIKQ